MRETRKLVAILVADVVGYSRLAGTDEDRTLSRLRGLRSDLIDPAIAAHHGRIAKGQVKQRFNLKVSNLGPTHLMTRDAHARRTRLFAKGLAAMTDKEYLAAENHLRMSHYPRRARGTTGPELSC